MKKCKYCKKNVIETNIFNVFGKKLKICYDCIQKFEYSMVLYDHNKLLNRLRINHEIIVISNSKDNLNDSYFSDYYPRFERVLFGLTKSIKGNSF